MEKLFQSILALQRRLCDAGISSIVIGGIAVGVWGDPRVTRDIDLKVLAERDDAERLWAALSSNYTALMPDPIRDLKGMGFLFVEDASGTRLDLLLADTPYDAQAIRRGREVELEPGATVKMCSPEDLIIYKMISTRPRDTADAESVIRRQSSKLDDDYVLDWLRQFEQALDDSTLVAEYKRLRNIKPSPIG